MDAFVPTERQAAADEAAHWTAWSFRVGQLWWARTAGRGAIEREAAARLDALIRHARDHSPLYRERFRGLAAQPTLAQLPVVTKRELMARFDAWATDPRIRRSDVETFVADRSRIGERYLGRYVVWKSSGTSGEPGIYIQDDDALTIYEALVGVQLARPDRAMRCVNGMLTRGGRAALVAATGDHFASIASWQRVCRAAPGLRARGFSIMDPLDDLVAALNEFAPAYLASYPTMLTVLAHEKAAGRLDIDPQIVWSGGEMLSPSAQAFVERQFRCAVINEYGASECLSIAVGCSAGWLHVNADWVLVEAVDAHYEPTPPGVPSHTVLVTNLANRVQPVIRYDLGDSIVMKAQTCSCGNPLPAMRVQGRCDDVITVAGASGRDVHLLPMALTTIVEEAAQCHRFQIVREAPDRLALRLGSTGPGVERDNAFRRAATALEQYLARQGARRVHVVRSADSPQRDPVSGKLRQVVLKPA